MYHQRPSAASREAGNILLLSFLLVTVLVALVTAHFAVVQKNSRQSSFFSHHEDLHHYCDSGVRLGLHELAYGVGTGDGQIGTEAWTVANDVGRDGMGGTLDEGEGDGIPTPGEPNLIPAGVGDREDGMRLLVSTAGTEWPDVLRIVATAYDSTAITTEEIYVFGEHHDLPGVAAIFVQEGHVDVNGNAFDVAGGDHNPNGSAVKGATPVIGIATGIGEPAGSNASRITAGIPSNRQDQITGVGGSPSIQETNLVDFDKAWGWFMAAPKSRMAAGNYTSGGGSWGSANDYRVSYVKGDLHLSGGFKGAGVLIVEGNAVLSGRAQFDGIVLVKGDCVLTGGGNGVHVYGSLFVGKSESNQSPTLTISGNSSARYSSLAVSQASQLIPPIYTILYWNDLK